MKKLILLSVLALIPHFALASSEKTVGVSGMVCAFCSQGIEKSFKALPEVQEVHVSLKEKKMHLIFNEGKELSDEKIEAVLKEAGYKMLREGA
ncbi:MAG: heavy-metal-associated domain-containing protein [Proteobacteria bacterium]|jgi:copper chaperone CopZ|nr:heavy-metal-associated domain-containing protein [Pseudomonadota bacterium]